MLRDWMRQITTLLTVTLLLLGSSFAMAASPESNRQGDPTNVIVETVQAENQQRWDVVPNHWASGYRPNIKAFLSHEKHKRDSVGYFNIKSAKVKEVKELPLDLARSLTPVDKHLAKYGDAKVFYVGIDYKVYREDKYFYNGVNYRLVTVVPEDGQWKIAQSADAPVDILVTLGYGFKSPSEEISTRIHQARHKGLAVNAKGDVLERFANSSSDATQQPEGGVSIMSSDHYAPYTIRVNMSHLENLQFYECEGDPSCIRLVNFTYYQKNGLGLEWGPSWHGEALKAGALAFKMYGWYAAYYPLHAQEGFDVWDDDRDQQYKVNSEFTSTNSAITAMASKGMHKADTNTLFLAFHRSGSCGSGYHGGVVIQDGTQCLAQNSGWGHESILHYYYDYSTTLSNQLLEFFTVL